MTAEIALRGTLAGAVVLALLLPAWAASASPAGDGDGTDISVTIVDPTSSPTPSPSSPSGSGSQPGRSGVASNGGTGDGALPVDDGAAPDAEGSGSSWIVVSGLESSVQGELNPFRGRVHSRVTVANRSETATVSGELVFRMRTLFGAQIGPAITRQVDAIEPGDVHVGSADLAGVGQWPLVQVAATFTPDGDVEQDPIVRDAWVLAFPWLLLVILVLVVAGCVVMWVRRDALGARFAPPRAP